MQTLLSIFFENNPQVSINNRFKYIVDYLEDGNKSAFCRKAGIKATTLSNITGERQTDPSSRILNRVIEAYPEIDALWLLSGKGEMQLDAGNSDRSNETTQNDKCELCKEKDKIIKLCQSQLDHLAIQVNNLEKDKKWLQDHIDTSCDNTSSSKRISG